jgi:hypothetical protein
VLAALTLWTVAALLLGGREPSGLLATGLRLLGGIRDFLF